MNNNLNSLFLLLALSGYSSAFAEQAVTTDSSAGNHTPVPLTLITGQFRPQKHADFVEVGGRYASRKNLYLHKEAYSSFKAMHRAAQKAGIKLTIRSATRNFKAQKTIWEAKWYGKRKVGGISNIHKKIPDPMQRALKILEYSSMPGSSRHHWGTDIDLNAFNNGYFASGEGKKVYDWLTKHAADFGFCQPYTAKGDDKNLRQQGYNEEKWHWSYKPLALKYTAQAARQLDDQQFNQFAGAETADKIGIVENYVLGINPDCLKP